MSVTRSCATALVLWAMLGANTSTQAQVPDPNLVWHTLKTPHFEIHYHEPLGIHARRAAAVAERAHGILSRVFGTYPHQRTQIVLADQSDSANGSATALPYNTVRLYATAPEDLSPLGDYDDWFTELITHEYTHIMHLDQVGGIPAIVNRVLGKTWAPNQVQPRWFIEGLAVHEESKHSAGGRIRSTMFDMFLRADALENRLLRLDQISTIADRWPHGNIWYLYGAYFVDFIAQRYGEEALKTIVEHYGRQPVPYGLNKIAKRATGHTFVELYAQFLDDVRRRYGAQKERVAARGLTEGRRITFEGEQSRSPRFLDNRRIVYTASDNWSRSELRVIDATSGAKLDALARVAGTAAAAPIRRSKDVIFSSIESFRDLYFFLDLFRYNGNEDSVTRLSRGLRAQEPDVSPDGRHVAYAWNRASTRHLAISNLSQPEKTQRILVRGARFEQVYTPRWSPDGRLIAFSMWRDGGYRDIRIVNVATGDIRDVTFDRAMDTGPAWSPDGKTLYFSSDRSGIANIYAYDVARGGLRQVTNVLGGAYQPDVSPDGRTLVYLGYTTHGFDVFVLPLNASRFIDALPYDDRRPEPSESEPLLTLESSRYEPLETLWPRAYRVDSRPDGFGNQIGISTEGSDVIGRHSYAARLAVGLERGDVTFDGSYTLQVSQMPIRIRAYRSVAPRRGLVVAGQPRTWIEEAVGASASLSYTFPRAFSSDSVFLSYSLSHVGNLEPFGGVLDPNTPPPILPTRGFIAGLSAGWSYSDVQRYIYDISASRGRTLGLNLSVADPILGSQYHVTTFNWSIAQYLTMPWLHHVLALRYAGGISRGDLAHRGGFAVGGFSPISVVDALVNNIVLGGAALRGYRPFDRVGTQYHLLQGEYRYLIYRLNRGVETLPAYVNRVHGSVFCDVGGAFSGPFNLNTFRVGVGTELLVDFTIGYFLEYTLRIGAARGLSEGGQTQIYGNIGLPF